MTAVHACPLLLLTGALCALEPQEAARASAQAANVEDAALGPPGAPVVITEFSDFLCPYSRRAFPILREVVGRYPGQVRWVFKHFPLSFHRQAPLLHEAAAAAGVWDKFWQMHDRIFAAETTLDRKTLVAEAAELGIPGREFEELLEARVFSSEVERDMEEGRRRGVDGTPTFFLNEIRLSGALSAEVFEYHLRRALKLPAALPSTAGVEFLATDPEAGHPLALGPAASAPVVKVFLDLRSPLLPRALPALKDMVVKHKGRTRFVLKCGPCEIYPDSALAQEIALSLAKRGLDVFEILKLCANTTGVLDASHAGSWGRRLGLGPKEALEAEEEVRRGTWRRQVQLEVQVAKRLGIKGFPSLLAEGTRRDGLAGLEEFSRSLERPAPGKLPGEKPGEKVPGARPICAVGSEDGDGAAAAAR